MEDRLGRPLGSEFDDYFFSIRMLDWAAAKLTRTHDWIRMDHWHSQ